MKRFAHLGAGVLVLALGLCAQAQIPPSLVGNRSGPVPVPGGLSGVVLFNVTASGGTWQLDLRGRRPPTPNPCLERPFPVVVTETSPGSFRIQVQASKVIQGCTDGVIRVTLVDDQRLEGQFGDGRPVKLERR